MCPAACNRSTHVSRSLTPASGAVPELTGLRAFLGSCLYIAGMLSSAALLENTWRSISEPLRTWPVMTLPISRGRKARSRRITSDAIQPYSENLGRHSPNVVVSVFLSRRRGEVK